jgi:hypothetical protein
MSRTKTAYGRIWVCGVVLDEASREVEVTGSNHGNHRASRLYAKKMCDLRRRGLSYKKSFFLFIFGFYVLTQKTSVLTSDLSALQH